MLNNGERGVAVSDRPRYWAPGPPRTDSAGILLVILLYEADAATILLLDLPCGTDSAAILLRILLYEARIATAESRIEGSMDLPPKVARSWLPHRRPGGLPAAVGIF